MIKVTVESALEDIKKILSIVHEKNLSWTDFAELYGYKDFNVYSYRKEKADIPSEFLKKLYKDGFNITRIVIGEGDIAADNEAGRILKEKVEKQNNRCF